MQTNTPSRPDHPQWLIEHRLEVAALANRLGTKMAGRGIDELRTVVDQHDVAYGVWADADSFDGIGILAIKGTKAMRDIVVSGTSRSLSITAFPCRCVEEAEALRMTIGEADLRH